MSFATQLSVYAATYKVSVEIVRKLAGQAGFTVLDHPRTAKVAAGVFVPGHLGELTDEAPNTTPKTTQT